MIVLYLIVGGILGTLLFFRLMPIEERRVEYVNARNAKVANRYSGMHQVEPSYSGLVILSLLFAITWCFTWPIVLISLYMLRNKWQPLNK